MHTIAVYNIKGGVGKTSTSVNLAWLAARSGRRTLLCDLDPQGASSFYFRVKPPKKFSGKKLVKGGDKLREAIRESDFSNLDLLPADISYRNIDILLDDAKNSKKRLRDALAPLAAEYDYIFLDCPPNITLLSENIFHAADTILIPIIPTTLSLRTLDQLVEFLRETKNKKTRLIPFFSMVERRKSMHSDTLAHANTLPVSPLKTTIPYSADVEKMGLHREPLHCFAPSSIAAKQYEALFEEMINDG